MRLLDLFCGAGGAAMGYYRAGFEVVGVDINPQPRFPFEFHQADAMTYPLEGFDLIHASPPCQAYSTARGPGPHQDLYLPTRERLMGAGLPYVIENVIGAPYGHGVILCGSMFGLTVDGEWLRRHRNFETSWLMWQLSCEHPADGQKPINVASKTYTRDIHTVPSGHHRSGTFEIVQQLMGIDWMNRVEIGQAIPPAYTEWIGRQFLSTMKVAV